MLALCLGHAPRELILIVRRGARHVLTDAGILVDAAHNHFDLPKGSYSYLIFSTLTFFLPRLPLDQLLEQMEHIAALGLEFDIHVELLGYGLRQLILDASQLSLG